MRRLIPALPVVLGLLCVAPAAHAATTFTPTRLDDPATGGTSCAPPATDCSLRAAVAAAQPGDTVSLGPNVYKLTRGSLFSANNITITGAGRTATTIEQDGSGRIYATGANNNLTISDLTLNGGNVTGAPGTDATSGSGNDGTGATTAGGASLAVGGALTMTDVTVVNAVSHSGKGGDGATSSTAGGGGGNGGAADGAINVVGSATLLRVDVSFNQAFGGNGGAGADGTAGGAGGGGGLPGPVVGAALTVGGTLTATDSLFSNNLAEAGIGGAGGRGGTTGGKGGVGGAGSDPADGGVLFSNGPVQLVNDTFFDNDAVGSGGGTGGAARGGNANGGAGGVASGGGGGAVAVFNGGSLDLDADTFDENTVSQPSPGAGGTGHGTGTKGANGVSSPGEGSQIEVVSSALAMRDTIFAAGIGATNCSFNGATVTDNGHNLDDGSSCDLSGAKSDLASTPALLGPLADNGGPTKTLALLAGSSAIGTGGAACVDDLTGQPLVDDQRGLPRLPVCDIGAFQGQPPIVGSLLITGTDAVGAVLTCTPLVMGGDLPQSSAWAWTRDGVEIPGQGAPTYAVTLADAGHSLGCQEAASNIYGSATAISPGFVIDALPPPPPPPPGKPKITKLRLSPSTVRIDGKEHVEFTLTGAAAKVTFTLEREESGIKVGKSCVAKSKKHPHGKSCTRDVHESHGPSSRSPNTGSIVESWTPSSKLHTGTYRLEAAPAGGSSETITFTLHSKAKPKAKHHHSSTPKH